MKISYYIAACVIACFDAKAYALNANQYTLPTIRFTSQKKISKKKPEIKNKTQSTLTNIKTGQKINSIKQFIDSNSWLSQSIPGGNPMIYLRGQRANILLNGSALSSFNSGAQNTSIVPTIAIKDIEINTNKNSVLYGSMGLGGTVSLRQSFENHDTSIYKLYANMPLGGGFGYYLNKVLDKKNFWVLQVSNNTQSTQTKQNYTNQINTATEIAVKHKTSKQSIIVRLYNNNQWLHYPGSLSHSQIDSNPYQSSSGKQNYYTKNMALQLKLDQKLQGNWNLELNGQYLLQSANGSYPNFKNSYFTQGAQDYSFKPKLTYRTKNTNITFGSKLQYQTFYSTVIIPKASQTINALFFQADTQILPKTSLEYGVRISNANTSGSFIRYNASNKDIKNSSQNNSVWAADIGFKYLFSNAFHASMSIARNYQLPFIDQSSATQKLSSGFGLKPQTDTDYQLKLNYKTKNISIVSNLYFMNIKNKIEYITGNKNASFNMNLPPTYSVGDITNIDYKINKSFVVNESFNLNKSWFHSGNIGARSVAGNYLPGAPFFGTSLNLKYLIKNNFSILLENKYTSNYYANGDFNNKLGKSNGHFTTGINLNYKLNKFNLSLALNNIFNKKYYSYITTYGNNKKYYYPAVGFNTSLTVSYKI